MFFFVLFFVCFISFTKFIFILRVSLLKPKKENMILPIWSNFDGVKYPNAPKIICGSEGSHVASLVKFCPVVLEEIV